MSGISSESIRVSVASPFCESRTHGPVGAMSGPTASAGAAPGRDFRTTHWSVVLAARQATSVTQIRESQRSNPDGRVDLNLRFTDPGREDTHTVHIAWGDGTEDTLDLPKFVRAFSLTHTFPSVADPLRLWSGSLRITDKDGSDGVAQLQFRPWTPLNSPVDTDQDGIPDGWELEHLGWIGADAQGDLDADGVPNLAEFIRGGDPSVPDAATLTLVRDQNRLSLSFTATRGDVAVLGDRKRYYSVLQSPNLVDWTAVSGGRDITGVDQVQTVRIPTNPTAAFFRLDVEVR